MPRRRLPRRPNALFQVFVLGQLTRTLLEREFASRGLSHEPFGVASAVGSVGSITPGDLADLLGMPPSTLTAHIGRLTRAGLVRRGANPGDRRSYTLELTDRGVDYVRAGAKALRAALVAVDAELGLPRDDVQYALELLEDALRRALDDSSASK